MTTLALRLARPEIRDLPPFQLAEPGAPDDIRLDANENPFPPLVDGPLARALSKLPPEIGAFAWQVERNDAQLASAIREGIAGTAMPAARTFTARFIAKSIA